jgi:hypothetical protein
MRHAVRPLVIGVAALLTILIAIPRADARVFVGFGFGFPAVYPAAFLPPPPPPPLPRPIPPPPPPLFAYAPPPAPPVYYRSAAYYSYSRYSSSRPTVRRHYRRVVHRRSSCACNCCR